MTRHAATACALLLAACAAAAQTVYRCGSDASYAQSPCPTGARPVDVADPRSDSQRREAAQVADTQARLARQLQAQRHEREAAAAHQGAAGIKRLPPAAPASAASASHHRDDRKKRKGHGGARPPGAHAKPVTYRGAPAAQH